RLPCPLRKIPLNQLQSAEEQAALGGRVALFLAWLRKRQLREMSLGVGTTRSLRLPSQATPMVQHLVPRDSPQPTAKRVSLALLAKTVHMYNHSLKHLLKDVGDIRLAQVPAAAPVKDQRRV